MQIKIPYGKEEKINIQVEDKFVAGIIEPNKVIINDEFQTLKNAIENPINSKNIDEFIKDSKNILFIVNDGTRPTPTAKVLSVLDEKIKNCNIKFIIATGSHRAPTYDEYCQMFGKHYEKFKDVIFVHNSKKEEDLVYLGKSQNGTEMIVNKLAIEADKIIVIGSVEPHYFAGYTGGRKAFLPGIASFKSIEQNHKFALDSKAKSLALKGNPVHEDFIDAMKFIKKDIFAIMTILDMNHNIYSATAGNIIDSFEPATEKANDVFAVKIKEKVDIVVAVAKFPMDLDLYQSLKAVENSKLALKKDGILILVSKCSDGIGPSSFAKLLKNSKDTAEEVVKKSNKKYSLGYHILVKKAEIKSWAKMWSVTNLPNDIPKKIFFEPYKSLQIAIDEAVKIKGKDAKILFFLDGTMTVPMIEK